MKVTILDHRNFHHLFKEDSLSWNLWGVRISEIEYTTLQLGVWVRSLQLLTT